MASKRVNIKAILADPDLRRKLMASTIQATQAREGIETTPEQADRAYYVVSEGERTAFFALEPFKGGKRGELDRRHEMFVRSLRGEESVRSDIARRDFSVIEGKPLAYDRVGLLAKVFRDYEAVEHYAKAYQGVITGIDDPYIRCHWEVSPRREERPWMTLHKGGGFSRFYYDTELVLDWSEKAQGEFHRLRDPAIYFRQGLTWPRRTQKGFNLRRLPRGCVFSDKGPSVFFEGSEVEDFFLGLGNSLFAEFVMRTLMSFGSWELTVIRRFPLAMGTQQQRQRIAQLAVAIHDVKAAWDRGNETSTRFDIPWILRSEGVDDRCSVAERLDALARVEAEQERKIQEWFASIDDAVFDLYRVPETAQEAMRKSLAERVGEILWAHMEGKSSEQKRMEHVWRLISYAVKRVIDADDDGVVPFGRAGGDAPLIDRVRQELAALFPGRDEGQLEVEIVNELKRGAKGYRKCASVEDWLANAFFEYHASLYKNRPIFWHICSSQGTAAFGFGALVHYHRFDKNRIAKLRASYVRDTIEELRRESGMADKAGRTDERMELQEKLEQAQALDKSLRQIEEGFHQGPEGGDRDFRILTPWKEPGDRPKGWNPDLDDGVKANIAPFDRAGILRVIGVAG